MKLFIDTANIDEIREIASWGVLEGVTTNPSLIAKEGRSFKDVIKEITELVDGPVSAEVISMDAESMVKEARDLAQLGDNVIIKIPMCAEGLKATSELYKEGIYVNMTLIFSADQALLAARAGARYVSPFLGRLDDIGADGLGELEKIVEIFEIHGIETEIISASIRNVSHIIGSALAGSDIATVPYDVFKLMLKHPLTDSGIEKFLADWESVGNL